MKKLWSKFRSRWGEIGLLTYFARNILFSCCWMLCRKRPIRRRLPLSTRAVAFWWSLMARVWLWTRGSLVTPNFWLKSHKIFITTFLRIFTKVYQHSRQVVTHSMWRSDIAKVCRSISMLSAWLTLTFFFCIQFSKLFSLFHKLLKYFIFRNFLSRIFARWDLTGYINMLRRLIHKHWLDREYFHWLYS